MSASQRVYLDAFLAPLAPFLGREEVTDLYINRPGEVWLETPGGIERHDAPGLDDAALWRLARQIAAASDQGINREHPLLAATLPDGARVQVCAPPATRGNLIFAVRRHSMPNLMLSDYVQSGAFSRVGHAALQRKAVDDELAALLDGGKTFDFLKLAVQSNRTIVISGGTGTGKTTFLNALLKEAPENERFVLIEDTPEIQLRHENAVGLVAVRGRLGEASVTPADLVEAALRLRPDRIIMGEVRGAEAISWLRAVGTGHPGSITTVHANSPDGAVEQLAIMSMLAGTELGRAELVDYVRATVDIIIQLGQVDGTRLVTEIGFKRPPAETASPA
ncbi:P-type DNA transfer ATPase VirB11 [Sphingomonas sabuli]|uniref:P-type DNA transfer ATPase VirB11 n=1 Tax=Sphingomonas sabuli TaxID=2764186 RepID=A0A7G9KZC6_9SPHN|nr:P-type DNA transfer ATPase VirB11 [Sphingomonas sabuli]QNM81725.1 P-type DNA transfer ATPase VirB11 [Sphingomonas sabuli]